MRSALFAVLYALAVLAGRATLLEGDEVALTWPEPAVATLWLAACSTGRRRLGVDLPLLVALTVLLRTATGAPTLVALSWAAVVALHGLVACAVLERWTGPRTLGTLADLRALAYASVGASAVSALAGTAALSVVADAPVGSTAAGLFMSGSTSTLLLVGLARRLRHPTTSATPARRGELVLLTAVGAAAFLTSVVLGAPFAMVLTVLPLAAWAALRLPTTTSLVLAVLNGAAVALVATSSAVPLQAGGVSARLLVSQAFIAVTGVLVLVLALHRDERSALIARLGESEQRFRLAFATAPTGMCLVGLDADRSVLRANPAMASIVGCDPSGGRLLELCDPLDRDALSEDLAGAAATGELAPVERRWRSPTGEVVWGQCSGAVIAPAGEPAYLMLLVSDVTLRREAEQSLRRQALHDDLTGLPNRTLLLERLASALADGPAGVLFLDLDGFKAVNDRAGHQTGDRLLQEVAERLRRAVRPGDTVARLGGDEFAVVCAPGVAADLHGMAERLREELARPYGVGGGWFTVTASVGTCLADPASAPEELLRRADAAMYAEKSRLRAHREALPRQRPRRTGVSGPAA